MSFRIHNREKGTINLVLTIVIAVFISQLSTSGYYWIGIIFIGLIQIVLVFFIPSIEEKEHQDRIEAMERDEKRKRDFKERSEKIKLSKKLQKIQNEAKKSKRKKVFISRDKFISLYELNEFRRKRK